MGRTKEEQFLIRLYEVATRGGDSLGVVNRYDIGKAVGISPKSIDTMCKQLMRTNFIKRDGEIDVHLTPHGEKLVHSILKE